MQNQMCSVDIIVYNVDSGFCEEETECNTREEEITRAWEHNIEDINHDSEIDQKSRNLISSPCPYSSSFTTMKPEG